MSIKSESGRSMLEMIAVICVIIVLTMGALTGYQQIIASHQAISLNEDILVQAQAQKGHNYRGRSVYDSGIGKKTRMGLVMTAMNTPNGETFSIVVQNIPNETCAYLTKKDWKDAVRIKINDSIYTPQNMECASLKESGNKTFNLEVFFPKIMASVARFERTCDRCMNCERCDTTMDVCVNNCPESAQFCQDNRCVFSHCPKGKDLQNGNCVDCITNYACSSCAETSSTDVYWSGTDCMCYGDSCGQGFYCQASGTCASCPTNATCEEGFIVCNNDYYQVGETCEACPENATCEDGVILCNEGYVQIDNTCINCPDISTPDGKGDETFVTGCFCPIEQPNWNGTTCIVATICSTPCPSGTQSLMDCTCSNNSCTDNTNCASGKYCKVSVVNLNGNCSTGSGTCTAIGTYETQNGYTYSTSELMNWDSAKNWCQAVLGDSHKLVSKSTVEGLMNSPAFYNLLKGTQASLFRGSYWLDSLDGGFDSCLAFDAVVSPTLEGVRSDYRLNITSNYGYHALCQ